MSRLQIIGEASRGLTTAFRVQHTEIPWTDIIGMRNILVHDYFGIDVEIVWAAVEESVPPLKERVTQILQQEGSDKGNDN